MPYAVKGSTNDGGELWLSSNGNWVPDRRHAGNFRIEEAGAHLIEIKARNSRADPEDRIEPNVVGSDQ